MKSRADGQRVSQSDEADLVGGVTFRVGFSCLKRDSKDERDGRDTRPLELVNLLKVRSPGLGPRLKKPPGLS
jgi:hypothetical protein